MLIQNNYSENPSINLLLENILDELCPFLEEQARGISELTAIGKTLGTGKAISVLLEMILSIARRFTKSDGGTLYRVDDKGLSLVFKVIHNESLKIKERGDSIGLPNALLYNDDKTPNLSNVSSYKNQGLADMGTGLELKDENGIPAPSWVRLNASSDIGTLKVGEPRKVSINFTPTPAIAQGMHVFYLTVASSNYQTTDIGLYPTVTQSDRGNVLFKLSDIYTGTFNAKNDEILSGLPQSLEAKQRVTTPYRITCLKSLDREEEGQTGGGCYTYRKCVPVSYRYTCTNGDTSNGSTRHCFYKSCGSCGGSGSGGSSSGTSYVTGGSGSSGTTSSPAPVITPLASGEQKCLPKPEPTECENACKETNQNTQTTVGSAINTVFRQFSDDALDLSVQVPEAGLRFKETIDMASGCGII